MERQRKPQNKRMVHTTTVEFSAEDLKNIEIIRAYLQKQNPALQVSTRAVVSWAIHWTYDLLEKEKAEKAVK